MVHVKCLSMVSCRTMYTIRQASIRAGVPVALLRQWERRYGIVQPARTASGYRLYDEAAIARLQRMRSLVDDGWTPSAAAAALLAGGDVPPASLPEATAPSATATGDPGADLVAALVVAAGALDMARIDALLDEMFARGTFEHTTEQLVLPALRQIGDAWAAGRGDVAAEHAVSHAVLHRLGAAYQAAGRVVPGRRPVLVGLPPGSRHELGALVFSVAARRSGLPVLFLGADLPARDWIDAVAHSDAVAAVIGVVTPADVGPAMEVAAALHAAHPGLVIAFGGTSSPATPRSDAYLRLPQASADAVDILASTLAADPVTGGRGSGRSPV